MILDVEIEATLYKRGGKPILITYDFVIEDWDFTSTAITQRAATDLAELYPDYDACRLGKYVGTVRRESK